MELGYSYGTIAWTMIYGTITPGGQVIPVQYMSGEKTLDDVPLRWRKAVSKLLEGAS